MPRRADAVRDRPGEAGEALRAHLLETAERLLAEQPPASLTTRAIARAAGVSDGVLYNYFAGKDDLVLAALTARFGRLAERLRGALPEPGAGELPANLETCARAVLDLQLAALTILAGLLGDPALARRFVRELHGGQLDGPPVTGPVAAYLRAEQEHGRLAACDPAAAADLLVGAVSMRACTTLLGVRRREIEAEIPALVRTLLGGIAG